MPIKLERLPGEPILIATFIDYISIDEIKSMYGSLADLLAKEPGTFYRITDIRNAQTDFMEMAKIVQAATQELAASAMDQRIQVTYVGSSAWINFARDVFGKRGVAMAAFEDMETALQSVQIRIAAEKAQSE